MANDDDANSFDLNLDPIEAIKGLALQAHADGTASNESESQDSDKGSSLHSNQEELERARKDARNARARARRQASKNGQVMPASSSKAGSPIKITRPQITSRVMGNPSVQENGNDDTGPMEPVQGVGAIGQAKVGINAFQNIAKNRPVENDTTKFTEDAIKTAKSVSKDHKEAAKDTPGPLNPAGNSASSGSAGAGSVTSSSGGTRPWWMKMQDTLDDMSDDLKRILDAIGHQKPGSSGNGNKSSTAKTGDVGDGLSTLLMAVGALIAMKFGGLAAQFLSGAARSVEGAAAKIAEGLKSGLPQAGKAVATFAEGLKSELPQAGKAVATIAEDGAVLLSNAKGAASGMRDAAGNTIKRASAAGAALRGEAVTAVEDTGKSLLDHVGAGARGLAVLGIKGTGKVLAGPLKSLAAGATLFGGAEAAQHGIKSYQKFATGDQIGGTAEALRTAAKIEEYGGPKNMLENIPVVGKAISKYVPDPIRAGANWVVNQGIKRIKSAVVTGGAIDVAGGGPENPFADVAGIGGFVTGLVAPQLAAKGLNAAADKIDSKEGRKNIGGAQKFLQDAEDNIVNKPQAAIHGFFNSIGKSLNTPIQGTAMAASVPHEAPRAAASAGMVKPNLTQNNTTNNQATFNIAHADITSKESAKKWILDAQRQHDLQIASQRRAAEKNSNVGLGNFFSDLKSINANIASIFSI